MSVPPLIPDDNGKRHADKYQATIIALAIIIAATVLTALDKMSAEAALGAYAAAAAVAGFPIVVKRHNGDHR